MPRPDASAFSPAPNDPNVFTGGNRGTDSNDPIRSRNFPADGANCRGFGISQSASIRVISGESSSLRPLRPSVKSGSKVCRISRSAFICKISGKIIASVLSVTSCKILPAESFRVFRVFRD